MKVLLFIISSLFLWSCGYENTDTNKQESENSKHISTITLLSHVKLAINPNFQDWVLFENGTYIIFDNAATKVNIKEEAVKLMKAYGPVYAGSPAGDFSVTHLNRTNGWVVTGDCYGMYTYVNPSELDTNTPDDVKIGLVGRSKREKDGANPKIIYVNRSR